MKNKITKGAIALLAAMGLALTASTPAQAAAYNYSRNSFCGWGQHSATTIWTSGTGQIIIRGYDYWTGAYVGSRTLWSNWLPYNPGYYSYKTEDMRFTYHTDRPATKIATHCVY